MTSAAPVHVRAALTDAEYAALAGFLAQQAGLVFDQTRRPALAAIVTDRIAETGAADLGAYLARISAPAGADERQRLLDEVTIPETHFFRNPPQMEALRRRLLPELMRRAVARGRTLTIWSAGCSTGEEPYSLAMLAAEVAASLPEAPRIRIVATDLSSAAVAATERGALPGPLARAGRPAQPRPLVRRPRRRVRTASCPRCATSSRSGCTTSSRTSRRSSRARSTSSCAAT